MDINAYTKTALKVTSSFEGVDGFAQITGNFDGEGLSAGALQWPFKLGNLQSIALQAIQGNPYLIARTMPQTGAAFQAAIQAPIAQGMQTIATWNDGNNQIQEPYLSELKAFWGSVEMITQQVFAAQAFAQKAATYANTWVTMRDAPNTPAPPTIQEFCFFFDVVVNNGSLRSLDFSSVSGCYQTHGGESQTYAAIIQWLEAIPSTDLQATDCANNASLWAGMLATASRPMLQLFTLAWLRSRLATMQYQGLVMNRKGMLAMGAGWVNGSQLSFSELSDA